MVDAPPSELHAARDPKPDSESESEFIDKAPPQSESPEPQLKTSSGRRRGRRKIMKKKTIKDDEGYLGNLSSLQYFQASGLMKVNSNERGTGMGVVFGR